MPEIQRRTKCSDNCTLERCFKSILKARTSWTLMRVGYQSVTSEDVAGTELAKTTQWPIESWDTRSISSALCLLKAPSGLLRLNATPTKTSCKCFCRSYQQLSHRSTELDGDNRLLCSWMELRTIDLLRLADAFSTWEWRSYLVLPIRIRQLPLSFGLRTLNEATSMKITSKQGRGKYSSCA